MSHDDRMWLPWRRSQTVYVGGPPSPAVERPRTFTEQHQHLLAVFAVAADEPWAQSALRACLDHLRVSTVTEAADVALVDAWIEGPTAFCIVYRNPDFDGLIGLRREASDARHVIEDGWEPTMITDGYHVDHQAMLAGQLPDPVGFGWNVADFDIGEPHARSVGDPKDASSITWLGNLRNGLPAHPYRPLTPGGED